MNIDYLIHELRLWKPPEPFYRQDHYVHVNEKSNIVTFTIDFKIRYRKDNRYYVRYTDHRDHLTDMLETRTIDLLEQVKSGLTLRAKAILNPAINEPHYYKGFNLSSQGHDQCPPE